MTRNEAMAEMKAGKKVKHYNFTREEYLHLVGGRVTTEDGYFFGDIFLKTDWMADGWSLF